MYMKIHIAHLIVFKENLAGSFDYYFGDYFQNLFFIISFLPTNIFFSFIEVNLTKKL